MDDKRRERRLKEESEIIITVAAGARNCSKGKVVYNICKDVSASGAKIQSNIFLPIDTLLKIDFKLKNFQHRISAMGKVKWIKIIFEDECYDAGVEFVHTPKEAIQKLSDYISWKYKCKGNMP